MTTATVVRDEKTGQLYGSRKIKVLDSIAFSHQFCRAVQEGKLTAGEAVEQFKPEVAWLSPCGKVCFVLPDNSYILQDVKAGTTAAHDRRDMPQPPRGARVA